MRAASNSYERALHLAKARQGADLILEPGINLQIAPLMHPSQRRRSGRGTPPVSARCRLAAGGGIGPVMRHRWAWAPKRAWSPLLLGSAGEAWALREGLIS